MSDHEYTNVFDDHTDCLSTKRWEPMADNTTQFRWIVTLQGDWQRCSVTAMRCLSLVTCYGIQWRAVPRHA